MHVLHECHTVRKSTSAVEPVLPKYTKQNRQWRVYSSIVINNYSNPYSAGSLTYLQLPVLIHYFVICHQKWQVLKVLVGRTKIKQRTQQCSVEIFENLQCSQLLLFFLAILIFPADLTKDQSQELWLIIKIVKPLPWSLKLQVIILDNDLLIVSTFYSHFFLIWCIS